MILELILYGRGGQGVVTGAQMIAEAAYFSKNFIDVSSFPSFGAERRGAPVQAFTRISTNETIWTRAQVYNPDIAIVLDETVMTQAISDNIKQNGMLIINTEKNPEDIITKFNISDDKTVVTSDITKICYDIDLIVGGLPIFNAPILGALSRVLGDQIPLNVINEAIEEHIGGSKGKLNSKAANLASAASKIRKGN